MESFILTNGVTIPSVGFGTYKTASGDDSGILKNALDCGYRHFDTAAFYGNEELLAAAVRESKIPRSELFLTTKVWKADMGYENTKKAFELSAKRLDTEYVDLYLIHWPRPDLKSQDWKKLILDTWRAMEELYQTGRIKAIGVCNFLPHHLMGLLEECRIRPMVNQIEFHPGYIQNVTVDFCQAEGIQVEAWSPIGRARVLQEPVLLEMAGRYQKSAAQICLRFALQNAVLPLPKSSSTERMKENLEIFDFDLSFEDMSVLMTLPQLGWSGEHPDRERVLL